MVTIVVVGITRRYWSTRVLRIEYRIKCANLYKRTHRQSLREKNIIIAMDGMWCITLVSESAYY